MFDFYVACVRKFSCSKDTYFWLPKKIYTSRSSCIRFFKTYQCKAFELHDFAIIRINQDSAKHVSFNEVFYGKD